MNVLHAYVVCRARSRERLETRAQAGAGAAGRCASAMTAQHVEEREQERHLHLNPLHGRAQPRPQVQVQCHRERGGAPAHTNSIASTLGPPSCTLGATIPPSCGGAAHKRGAPVHTRCIASTLAVAVAATTPPLIGLRWGATSGDVRCPVCQQAQAPSDANLCRGCSEKAARWSRGTDVQAGRALPAALAGQAAPLRSTARGRNALCAALLPSGPVGQSRAASRCAHMVSTRCSTIRTISF